MATDFWFKFRFKDWAEDAQGLSITATGLLISLAIYLRKTPVPGEMEIDVPLLCRLSGGLTEQVTEALSEFRKSGTFDFEFRGGAEFLIARGIKKEFRQSTVNKENGSKGGNPRLSGSVNRNLIKADNRTSVSVSVSYSDSDSEFENKEGGTGEETGGEGPEEKFMPQVREICAYLNERASTGYKPTSGKTKALIAARLRDGFIVEDFRYVIDVKCNEWIGTENEKYLRPETLFGPKFEGYRNQKMISYEKSGNNNQQSKFIPKHERDAQSRADLRAEINSKLHNSGAEVGS